MSEYGSTSHKFTTRDLTLRLHEWYLSHKFQLRKWWVLAILILDTGLIVYSIVSLLFFFALTNQHDRQLVKTAAALVPPQAIQEVDVQPIETLSVDYISHGADNTDFVALVSNANSDWWANITYHFTLSGRDSQSAEIKILPGQSLYLTLIGQEMSPGSVNNNAKLFLEKVDWQRITDRVRLNNFSFETSNVLYESTVIVPNSSQQFSRVSAKVTNNSLYGYWSVDVHVILKQNSKPVAVRQLLLRQFKAGETQNINTQWFDVLPSQLEVVIQPVVDIFDESNYMNLR